MPDICMCNGEGCPPNYREKCYRFKATPSEYWQSYFMTAPYDKKKKDCKSFLPR